MSWLIAAIISFSSFAFLCSHFKQRTIRRAMGYAMWIDIAMHGAILWMFFGTSTLGLIQAEAAGILFSVAMRGYRWAFGYERLQGVRWVRYRGVFA